MTMARFDVTIEVRTRSAQVWLRCIGPLRFVVGHRIAYKLALWGVHRFVTFRVGRGPWQRFDPEVHAAIAEDLYGR